MSTVMLTMRDEKVLEALWKWKMLSGAAIWKGFFPGKNANTCYERLLRLRVGGYIERRELDAQSSGYVWYLSPKGFKVVQQNLCGLKEQGYLSESILHDAYVTAVHAGDWLVQRPEHVELFSEQELRRYEPDIYPSWVPYSELHRPDGYWRIRLLGEMVTIALEVELSKKTPLRYRMISNFYQERSEILRVVWVVLNEGLMHQIRSQFKEANPESLDLHDFLLLKDFKQLGWSTPFVAGLETGRPLKEMLNGGLRHPSYICRTHDLLNFRKAPGKSQSCKIVQIARNRD